MQDVEPDQPQHSDSKRVLELGNCPVLQRAAGGAQMISETHHRCHFLTGPEVVPARQWDRTVLANDSAINRRSEQRFNSVTGQGPEFRMTVMPLDEIIDEIDAYLSRLRQARELLLDRRTEAPQKRVPRRKGKVTPRQADPPSSGRRRADKNKSRSNHPVAHLKKGTGRVEISAQVPDSVRHHVSHPELAAIREPERTIPQTVVVKRLPPKGPSTSIRSMRHKSSKPTASTKPDDPKPAIALAGPTGAKIVVVPAEQVRRERERTAQPEVRRPRVPASGLTGRLAFEALFK
jgi:hypothetical protein